MPDRHEEPGAGNLALCARLHILDPDARDPQRSLGPQDLGHRRIPDHLDLRVLEQPILHDLLGPETVPPVDHRHLRREIGQEQRLFHRRIPAPDHHDLFPAIEEPVAGRTGRHAEPLELLLTWQPQPLGLRPRRQDHCIRRVGRPAVRRRHEGPLRQVEAGDVVRDHLRPHRLGMFLHPHHQVRPLHRVVARPVLHLGRDGQLAPGLQPLHQDRIQHRPRRIDRRRIARRARADDQNPCMPRLAHAVPRKSDPRYSHARAGRKAPAWLLCWACMERILAQC